MHGLGIENMRIWEFHGDSPSEERRQMGGSSWLPILCVSTLYCSAQGRLWSKTIEVCSVYSWIGLGSMFSKFNKKIIEPTVHCHVTLHFSPMKSGHLMSMSGGLPIKHEGSRFPPKSCVKFTLWTLWTTIRRQGCQCTASCIWVCTVWCWLPAH